MARIRRTGYLDKYKLKRMISFLSTDAANSYTKVLMNTPFSFLHNLLPLKLKFLPESFVLVENKDIIGMITVIPSVGNSYRINISRLFLEQNYFNAGKQLVEFIIAKFGAKGANTFMVSIDDSYDELLQLFTEGCGFRQCSSEQLWKMEEIRFTDSNNTFFRPFKNSDAQAVTMIFNDSINSHFKHSLSKTKDEFIDPLLLGLNNTNKFKYVVEDPNLKTVQAYFSITTGDNFNYILDIISSNWYEIPLDDIFEFAVNQISKRKKDFYLFVKSHKYRVKSEAFEKYLIEKGFHCVRNQLVLVKDFYKLIQEPEFARKIVLFGEINEKPVFKI